MFKTIYTTFLKDIFEKVGLDAYVVDAYLLAEFGLLNALRGKRVITATVNGQSATYLQHRADDRYAVEGILHKEAPLLTDLLTEVDADDVFYDIGANIGIYACLIGTNTGAEVVAFEPVPENLTRLAENMRANGIQGRIFQLPLAADAGIYQLRESDSPRDEPAVTTQSGTQEHTLVAPGPSREAGPGSISRYTMTTTGDTLLARAKVPPPDVLKIDVEGAELAVLRGFTECLETAPPRKIYCEVHPEKLASFSHTEEELLAFLRASEYGIDITETDGPTYTIEATSLA